MKGGWIKHIVYRIIDSALVHDRNEIKVAVMCFFIAAALWFLNALNNNYVTQIIYPISFQYDSTHFELKPPIPKYLKLNISGQGWKILKHNLKVNSRPINCKILKGQTINSAFLLPIAGKNISEFKVHSVMEDSIKINLIEIPIAKN